jgi:prepilin-type processing-associated H-X9-DG protein
MKRPEKTIRFFTILELLLTVAVIVVLMGMLLPMLKNARETTYGIACLSNIKQIGQGWMMYISDNNGGLPPGRTQYWNKVFGSSTPKYFVWSQFLQPYIGESESYGKWYSSGLTTKFKLNGILACPKWRITMAQDSNYAFYTPYGMNSNGVGHNNDFGNEYAYGNIKQLKRPNLQILIGDSVYPDGAMPDYGCHVFYVPLLCSPDFAGVSFRHLNKASTLYCDGHALFNKRAYFVPGSDWRNEEPWGFFE